MRRGVFLLVACLTAAPAYAQRVQTTDQVQHIICDSGCGQGGVGASVDISSVSGTVIVGGDVPVKFSTPQHVVVDSGGGGGGLTDAQLRASAVSVTFTNTSIVLGAGAATIGAVNLAQYTPVSGRLPVDGSGVTQPVSHANFANLDAALSTLASQSTLALIKAKTDNLDVLLSTRTKPADAQHAIIDSGSVTFTNASIAITGSVAVTGPLTDTQLRASNVGVSLAAETTKVIGTVNQGTSPWVSNVTQFGSAAVTLGQKTSANAIPVVRSSDELPPPDRQASGDITTVTTLQSMTTSGSGTTRLTIIGTWTGTLTFVGFDGTTSYVTKAVNISTGALESSTTANGSWWVPTTGATVFIVVGPTSSGTASLTFAASPASSTMSLAQSLPTGTNSIGQVTANAGTNLNTSLLALETTQQTGNSYLNVLANARNGPPLPLFPCNAVRQTKCQPKGY